MSAKGMYLGYRGCFVDLRDRGRVGMGDRLTILSPQRDRVCVSPPLQPVGLVHPYSTLIVPVSGCNQHHAGEPTGRVEGV